MAHFSPNPTVFVAGIDLTDRGYSQEVWVPLIIHHTACDTAPKLHPLYADTLSLNSPHPAHLSLSTSQTSAGSTLHSWITLNHHRRSTICLQSGTKPHGSQQHGEQHVMCPPAQLQILQQEFHTQKQVRTLQLVLGILTVLVSVWLLYTCHALDCRLLFSTLRFSWKEFLVFLLVWTVGWNRGCEFCGARFRIRW